MRKRSTIQIGVIWEDLGFVPWYLVLLFNAGGASLFGVPGPVSFQFRFCISFIHDL